MADLLVPLLGLITFLTLVGGAWGLRAALSPDRSAASRVAAATRGTGLNRSLRLFADTPKDTPRFQLSSIAAPSSEASQGLLRDKLVQAGFRSGTNLERYLSLRAICALIPPVVSMAFVANLKLEAILVVFLGTASLGYYLPAILLDLRIRRRQADIMRPFPDALDLLVCCVEAGLGIDAAFRRVADEMAPAAPLLSAELQLVNHEIAAGVTRADALRGLDRRTGLSEMGSLVSVLVQSDRFGTSIAKALRIHAELVRTKRMLVAEEQAAQISPKLTVVMILFILPTLMVVLVGPAIINIGRNLWPALSGGGM
jgi:tight adherence protein C